MSPTLIGTIGIVLMLAIFMTRMPVAYVMALVWFAGFSFMISLKGGLNLLSRNIYEAFSSYGLTTIPLFILMGQFAFNSGISRRLLIAVIIGIVLMVAFPWIILVLPKLMY